MKTVSLFINHLLINEAIISSKKKTIIVVEIGFDPITSLVNESAGTYEICVFLLGQIERVVSVSVTSIPANSPGTMISIKYIYFNILILYRF